jgi:hypothetical protein
MPEDARSKIASRVTHIVAAFKDFLRLLLHHFDPILPVDDAIKCGSGTCILQAVNIKRAKESSFDEKTGSLMSF